MKAAITERTPEGRTVLASSEPIRPTAGVFRLGGRDVPQALPPMLWRMRLLQTYNDTDAWGQAAVYAAAIGLCWGAPDGPDPEFAKHRRDVLAYGEAVYDWLVEQGVALADIAQTGVALLQAIGETLPRQSEVDAAAVPSEATTGPSTASSSPSASPGTAIPSPPTT